MKGIDPRARARAKTAARREGLTLGEWINRVILDGSDPSNPQWDDALEAYPGFGGGTALSEEDDRLLRAMVNRLTERVESSEKLSARTLSGIDKAITQLADKISKNGERYSAELAAAQESLERVRKGQDELGDRVRSLESTPPGSGSTEDVRAVETTIMKLARRLYEHENDTAARLHAVDEDTRSVSETLEARLARLEARAEDTVDRNRKRDDETARTISGLRTVTETLKARVEGAERITNDAARALESSVARLDDRMRHLETRNSGDTVELERRFERLSDDVARIIAETRSQVAQAVSGAASEPRIDRLEDALTRAMTRMDEAERRQGDNMSRLGREITKLAGAIDRRLSESERRSAEALRESQSESKLDRRLDAVRQESREAIKQMGEEVTRLGRSLADRIEHSERRANAVVETATDRMAEMIEKFDTHRTAREEDLEDRLRQSEERTAKRIEDALGSVQERMASVRSETEEALSPVQRAMSALADRLEAIEGRQAPKSAPSDTPADSADEAEEDIDFDTPLGPPPQAETPVSDFDDGENDPFLAEMNAQPAPRPQRPAEAQPQPERPRRRRARAEAAPAEAVLAQPAPVQPQQPPARRPRPSGRLGATADADFLAAARERTRSTAYHPGTDAPHRQSRMGRLALYALPVIALVMLSGAGVILVWEAMQGDSERETANAAVERDFIAQVEAGFSSEAGAATPASAPEQVDTPAAGTQIADASDAPAPPADEPVAGAPPAREPAPREAATPPANAVADVSGTVMPASEPVSAPEPAAIPAEGSATGRMTLESAASEGHPVARYQLGLQALESGDAETAAILLRRAAEQGVPAAQYRYAKLLETGEGVEQDLEDARRWTERAANAGHRRAMHNLGVMYYYGTGVAENIETAARWFQEAALLGLRDSQFNLALLYESGDGVPLSLPDAYAWFTIASMTGSDPTAGERARAVSEQLDPAALAEAQATADGFTPRPLDAEANGLYNNLPWDRTVTTDAAQVRRAQGFLSVLGYAPGPIDGEMGGRTRDAIMAFEADQGLPRTGRVDAVLIERLERAAAG
ncbi:MAG: peptidoglycan-binding protein [Pseudomonadota bacterium]|nr:peptidoglycan-binding protein [Pseudomonadota bacterium]